jgi:DNA-binding beta-propeller fold protein YncE
MYRAARRGIAVFTVTAGSLALAAAAQAAPVQVAAKAPVVTLASSSDTFRDIVINPKSTIAYLTVPSENQVDVLNLKTGVFAAPIPVGPDPLGLDITPDGKTLLVCDGTAASISEVKLKTGKVTTIATPVGIAQDTAFSIVALNNGTALFTTTFAGSGFGADAYDLNLSTDAFSVVSGIGIRGQVTEITQLSRSADYSTAAAVLGDDSGGPFDVYTAATGNVVAGSLNEFISSSALSGDGSTLVVDGFYVINAATGALVGTISGGGGNTVLNAAGTTGYALSGGSITELNIAALSTGSVISLPGLASGGDALAMSPNGKWLVAGLNDGAAIVKL